MRRFVTRAAIALGLVAGLGGLPSVAAADDLPICTPDQQPITQAIGLSAVPGRIAIVAIVYASTIGDGTVGASVDGGPFKPLADSIEQPDLRFRMPAHDTTVVLAGARTYGIDEADVMHYGDPLCTQTVTLVMHPKSG